MPEKANTVLSPNTKPPIHRKKDNLSVDSGAAAPAAHLRETIDQPASAHPAEILALQRQFGNQAVQRLIQRKVTVGAANDPLEVEADRMADKVMGASQSADIHRSAHEEEEVQTSRLQRQGEEEEIQTQRADIRRCGDVEQVQTRRIQRQADEDELQTKRADIQRAAPEEEEVQTQRQGKDRSDSFEAGADVESDLHKEKGSGAPLPGDVRGFMETRFGADFSGVRVHADGAAAKLNRKVSAQAFTHGSDIYMGDGKFRPDTSDGQHLLAHELTHVVQQGAAGPSVQRLIGRADFVRLSGEASKMAAHNKSTYWRILKFLDDYQKAKLPKDKKMILFQLGRDINTWLDQHREHKAVSDEPGADIDEYASDKGDMRKEKYLLKLKEEVKAEYTGKPSDEETPSEIIEGLNEAAQLEEEHVKTIKERGLPKTDKYSLTVVAAIENKDYLDFARKRLKVTIQQKFKPFGKLDNNQIKHEAARQVIEEKYKDLDAEERLEKIEELADAGGEVGHTWVIFKHLTSGGQKISENSYGFWPLDGFRHPTMPVPGAVVTPDTQHEKDPEQRRLDFQIKPEQYLKGLDRAVTVMKSPPEYRLIEYNCTKFARDIALTVGVTFPENAYMTVPKGSMKAWNPNALFNEMEKDKGSYNPIEQAAKAASNRDELFQKLRPQLTELPITVYTDDMERKPRRFDGEDFYWYWNKNKKLDFFRVLTENDKDVSLTDENREFLTAPKDVYYTWSTKVTEILKQINGGSW
jgi:hypothetical protein